MLTIKFAGLTEALGPFTWAQSYMWDMIHRAEEGTRSQFNTVAFMAIPENVSLERISEAFLGMVERYDTFRTVFRVGEQRVMGSGEVDIDIIDQAESFSVESEEAQRLFEQLQGEEFDLGAMWPYRASLVCRSGVPAFLIVVMSHMTTDGFGGVLFQREFTDLLLTPSKRGRTAFQQLEIAAYQKSPDGQALNARAIEHWEKMLRRYYDSEQSRQRYSDSADGAHTISMVSNRLASSVSAAARRYTTTPSTLLLAAATFAYATIVGQSSIIIEVACANRFKAWARSQGTLFQFGIAEFLFDGSSFASIVRSSETAARAAYANSQYDPLDSGALKRSISGDADPYSELPSVPFVVNDMIGWCLPAIESNTPPTFGEFGDIDSGATGYAFYLGYHRARTGVRLGLEFDTAMLTGQEAVSCLSAIDRLLLAASRADLTFHEAQNIVRQPGSRPLAQAWPPRSFEESP